MSWCAPMAGAAAAAAFTAAAALALPPGDPARGAQVYQRCIGCHSLDRDRTGPRHADLFGRRIGGVQGFAYSEALRKAGEAGLAWDEKTLDAFLRDPRAFLPGTRMGYAGVKDAQERADLIAFLKAQRGSGPARDRPR